MKSRATGVLTFEFRTWPGRGIVRVRSAQGVLPAIVRLNGVDVTARGIEFLEGQEMSGIEIEIRGR